MQTVSGCATLEFTYNALGQRVETKIGATNPVYRTVLYDGLGQVIAWHNRTTYTNLFLPLGGQTFATYEASQTFFLHSNHLGSTTFVTDHTGATIQKTIYYPYGQLWQSAGTIKDERFASLNERDSETSLDPTLFRMYHSRLYRWLSPDPVAGSISNPQSLNRYAYVLNNPCNFIDPLGLECNIAIINAASLSSYQMGTIQSEMGRIFAEAGVDVRFDSSGATDFFLRIVPSIEPFRVVWNLSARTVANTIPDAQGMPTNIGNVFLDQVALYGGTSEAGFQLNPAGNTAVVIARAGAHEVGHFLLGTPFHSYLDGAMKAAFSSFEWFSNDSQSLMAWRFTPEHEALLQMRCGSAGAGRHGGGRGSTGGGGVGRGGGGPSGVPRGGGGLFGGGAPRRGPNIHDVPPQGSSSSRIIAWWPINSPLK